MMTTACTLYGDDDYCDYGDDDYCDYLTFANIMVIRIHKQINKPTAKKVRGSQAAGSTAKCKLSLSIGTARTSTSQLYL